MTRTILSIILLGLSCSTILSYLPHYLPDHISTLIVASHVILFILYSLNREEEKLPEIYYRKMSRNKDNYTIIRYVNTIDNKRIVEYKHNNSNISYYMDEEDFYDNFKER